jgi:hypothetical protein
MPLRCHRDGTRTILKVRIGGVEGLEGRAGRVEVGILTQGLANAVMVELPPHRAEDTAERQVGMMLVNMLGDLGQDRAALAAARPARSVASLNGSSYLAA